MDLGPLVIKKKNVLHQSSHEEQVSRANQLLLHWELLPTPDLEGHAPSLVSPRHGSPLCPYRG